MSIASEITRLAGLRDTIRSKLLDFGIITDSSANLSACSEAINDISESTLSASSIAIAPSMSIASSTGIVTASGSGSGTATASKGYSKGTSKTVSATASNTLQLTTQGAQTITPGTSNKTIAAGRWITGAQTIKGDSNLVAANIKSGVSIFGVSGNLTSFKEKIVTMSGSQCSYESKGRYYDGEDYTYYWNAWFEVDISGISPRYVSMINYSSTGKVISYGFYFAITNGTSVILGLRSAGGTGGATNVAGTTLGMNGSKLQIPYQEDSYSSSTNTPPTNTLANYTFKITILGV